MQARGSTALVSINTQVLDDLCSRFLINLPEDEKKDPIKLSSHLELAHWFYLDLLRPEDHSLPACNFKEFITAIFSHYAPLKPKDLPIEQLIIMFKTSKARKPLRGAIILNEALDKCLLVQGYLSSSTWGFPKGKAEDGENELQSAARETYEETGFDIQPLAKEEWYIEKTINEQHYKLYIVPGVSEHYKFSPQTRKEIRDIQWFQINSLPQFKKDLTSRQNLGMKPNDFYRIIPFIKALRMWIENYKKESSYGNTIATMAHMTNSRSNTTLTPPSHIPPVVMATSVASTGNALPPPIDYSASDIIFNQPPRYSLHLPPSTVNNRQPSYIQPRYFIHTAGNQYIASTGIYTHQLLATPRSQKFPTHSLLPSPHRNVLLPRHPHPAIQQYPYPPVQQYPPPPLPTARPLMHPMPGHGLVQHSKPSCELI